MWPASFMKYLQEQGGICDVGFSSVVFSFEIDYQWSKFLNQLERKII